MKLSPSAIGAPLFLTLASTACGPAPSAGETTDTHLDAVTVAPLGSPTNVTAVLSERQVIVTWVDNATAELAFDLQCRDNAGPTSYPVMRVGANVTSAVARNGPAGCYAPTGSFRVVPIGANNVAGQPSVWAPVTPPPPDDLRAVPYSGSTGITLVWTDPDSTNGAGGYRVERATAPNGTFSTIATYSGDGTNYSYWDRAVSESVTYYYRVRALSLVGNPSPPSGVVWAAPPPNAPTAAGACMSAPFRVKVRWQDNSKTESIFLIDMVDGSAGGQGSVPANTQVFETMFRSSTTRYRVTAVNANGYSAGAWTSAIAPTCD